MTTKRREETENGRPRLNKPCRPHPLGGDFVSLNVKNVWETQSEEGHWKIVSSDEIDPCEFFQDDTICHMANTFANFIAMIKEANRALQKQNTSGGPRTIRDRVCRQLEHIALHMEAFGKSIERVDPPHKHQCPEPERNHRSDTRFDKLANDIEEIEAALNLSSIEAEIKDLKAAFHETPKTWANIVANTNREAAPLTIKARVKRREMQEKLRKEREPYEVILTTSNIETKEELNAMHANKITEQCQNIMDKNTVDKPKINRINRITNGIRLQCKSPEDAKLLRQEVDWNTAFKELAVHQPKYSIVVHGISTARVTGIENGDIQWSTVQEWEEKNGIKIKSIKQLRRKPRSNKPTSLNSSIIVFTEDHLAADKCIKLGFFINSFRHKAEKYAPQLHITQCYNCYD